MPELSENDAVTFVAQSRGWSIEDAIHVVRQLVGMCKWSYEAVVLGFRAGFQCEYCGRDLLASADDYKLWEREHIVRRSPTKDDSLDNLALACLLCNTKFKNRWCPSGTGRQNLVAAVQDYVRKKRKETEHQLDLIRKLVRWRKV